MWSQSVYREKQTESHIKAWQNDVYRKSQSEKRKHNWQDRDYRAKTTAAGKASRQNTEYLDNQRLKAYAQWNDPLFRERELKRRSEAPRKIWINNGIVSRTIYKTEPLPYGFRIGRLYHRKRTND